MGKKISVFRKDDVEYLKRYLLEAVREVLLEEEKTETLECPNESGGVRFEWAIIAEAIDRAGGNAASKTDGNKASPACGKVWGAQGVSDSDRKKVAAAKKTGVEPPEDILRRHQANLALDLVEESRLIPPAAFAHADTYRGPSPKGGGDPKTDITFGEGAEYTVSVKMKGGIQLASSEGESTANSMKMALKQFAIEHREAASQMVADANGQVTLWAIKKHFRDLDAPIDKLTAEIDDLTKKMMKSGYEEPEEKPSDWVPTSMKDIKQMDARSPRRYLPGPEADTALHKEYESWVNIIAIQGAQIQKLEAFETDDEREQKKNAKKLASSKKKYDAATTKKDKFEKEYEAWFGQKFAPSVKPRTPSDEDPRVKEIDRDMFRGMAARVKKATSAAGAEWKKSDPKKVQAKVKKALDSIADKFDAETKEIMERFDWNKWEKDHKVALVEQITKLLNKNPDFKFLLVDEELSGRRKFKDNPAAAADYILSPTYFEYIGRPDPEDKEAYANYKATVQKYVDQVTIDARAKSRKAFSSVTYRFDIKPAAKKAIEKVAEEGVAQAATVTEGKFTDWIKKGWAKLKSWTAGFKEQAVEELEATLVKAVDVDALVDQMAEDPSVLFDFDEREEA